MTVKENLGKLESSTLVCVGLAVGTFIVPSIVSVLWLVAALMAQTGTWNRIKTLLYVTLNQQKQKALAGQMIKPTVEEEVKEGKEK